MRIHLCVVVAIIMASETESSVADTAVVPAEYPTLSLALAAIAAGTQSNGRVQRKITENLAGNLLCDPLAALRVPPLRRHVPRYVRLAAPPAPCQRAAPRRRLELVNR